MPAESEKIINPTLYYISTWSDTKTLVLFPVQYILLKDTGKLLLLINVQKQNKIYASTKQCCRIKYAKGQNLWFIITVVLRVCAKSLQLCSTLCDPMDYSLPGSSVHGDSLGKNPEVGCHALLQRIFPTQGLNPHLLCFLH